jgi:hypothetical protein
MKEWLEKHDAISLHWIEKKIGLKTGSLHKGREIPTRYLEAIEKVLMDYGYKYSRGEETLSVGVEMKATGERLVVRYIKNRLGEKVMQVGTYNSSNFFEQVFLEQGDYISKV